MRTWRVGGMRLTRLCWLYVLPAGPPFTLQGEGERRRLHAVWQAARPQLRRRSRIWVQAGLHAEAYGGKRKQPLQCSRCVAPRVSAQTLSRDTVSFPTQFLTALRTTHWAGRIRSPPGDSTFHSTTMRLVSEKLCCGAATCISAAASSRSASCVYMMNKKATSSQGTATHHTERAN